MRQARLKELCRELLAAQAMVGRLADSSDPVGRALYDEARERLALICAQLRPVANELRSLAAEDGELALPFLGLDQVESEERLEEMPGWATA